MELDERDQQADQQRTNPMLPAVVGFAGTITQFRSAVAIQPLDWGAPATALAETALTITCTTNPNTAVAAEDA